MKQRIEISLLLLLLSTILSLNSTVCGETDFNDYEILFKLFEGLENPELLNWPINGDDPCGPPRYDHVFCNGSRVAGILVEGLGLRRPLPKDFNKLTELTTVNLRNNKFNGTLPSFNGLAKLQSPYLDDNEFDTISFDFFTGLNSLQVLSLDYNPLNKSDGWMIPPELENSRQMMNLSMIQCNLVGQIPDFLVRMASLTSLKMSYNNLSGGIPASFHGSSLQTLWLNNQIWPNYLTGTIDVVASMTMLEELWLDRNEFTGTIPSSIGNCVSLRRLRLRSNVLVGLVPANLTSLPQLEELRLDGNFLMGPMPVTSNITDFSSGGNMFCKPIPGRPCSPEVSALLDFLSGVNFGLRYAITNWGGDDPCYNSWPGIGCSNNDRVSFLNFRNEMLSGTISPSLVKLEELETVWLDSNNLTGTIPAELTSLKSLRVLNLSNNLAPPIPRFADGVTVITAGNPLLDYPRCHPPNSPTGRGGGDLA